MTNLLHTKKKIIHFFPRLINGNEFLARNSFGDYVNRILGGILIPWIQYIEMWRLWLTGLAMWCMRSRITFEAKRHPLISHRAKEREGERVRNSKTRVNSFWSIKGGCVRLCYSKKKIIVKNTFAWVRRAVECDRHFHYRYGLALVSAQCLHCIDLDILITSFVCAAWLWTRIRFRSIPIMSTRVTIAYFCTFLLQAQVLWKPKAFKAIAYWNHPNEMVKYLNYLCSLFWKLWLRRR